MKLVSKGRVKKKLVEFSTKRLTLPPLVEKKNKENWSMLHETNSVWCESSDTCQMASLESFKG